MVIEAIHASTSFDNMNKFACVEKAFAAKVISIVAYDKEKKNKRSYELTFTDRDIKEVDALHSDALVIIVNINTFYVKRVLIDPGSSSEIMYHSMFMKLKVPPSQVKNVDSPVFTPTSIAEVPVRLGPKQKIVEFIVMDIDSPYNGILGRGWLRQMKEVTSPLH